MLDTHLAFLKCCINSELDDERLCLELFLAGDLAGTLG
jgi:hypothetical protein